MVNTTIDSNPLDPNYVERRSSLDASDQSQRKKSAEKGMDIFVDRNVAPYVRYLPALQYWTDNLYMELT